MADGARRLSLPLRNPPEVAPGQDAREVREPPSRCASVSQCRAVRRAGIQVGDPLSSGSAKFFIALNTGMIESITLVTDLQCIQTGPDWDLPK